MSTYLKNEVRLLITLLTCMLSADPIPIPLRQNQSRKKLYVPCVWYVWPIEISDVREGLARLSLEIVGFG